MSVSQSGELSTSAVFHALTQSQLNSYHPSKRALNWRWPLPHFCPAKVIFFTCLLVVTAVSAYDAWLVYQFRQVIELLERNLICLTLIKLDPETLVFFIAGKAIGTLVVIASLLVIWRLSNPMGLASAIGVTIFQIGLLCYLTLMDFKVTSPF